MSSTQKIIVSCILGVCFVLGAVALGLSFYKTKAPTRTLSVVGLASKEFESDLIVLNFNYSFKDMDKKVAYEGIKKTTQKIKDFLSSNGIKDADVTFKPLNVEEKERYVYDNAAGRSYYLFDGYEAQQNVRIESKDIDKVEALDFSTLLDEDILVDTWAPEYYYTKLADLKIEMLSEATKDAHTRAETIVKNAGGKLNGLKNSNMGVFQITAPNSNDEDYTWGGAFNTSSKRKCATINMRLTYFVK
ncbi:MAG: SIMPL domain-containing protein [Bacteroidales bacterium]|nr:SIMPL domain-containing protein [Bacteroidales bacterium]